ncbi:MAG: hypothetical protein H6728_02195 [Myxococcales bacterium]|nr:hypothetical protein [Myxococcales bacterium]MCB9641864.1 hypothetical protein [Myxococcales bacterium]
MFSMSRIHRVFRRDVALWMAFFGLVGLWGSTAKAESTAKGAPPASSHPSPTYLATLADRWLVILGGDTTPEGIASMRQGALQNAQIVNSTLFAGLNPGWFILVGGAAKEKSAAMAILQSFRKRGKSGYLRHAKKPFAWSGLAYRVGSFPKTFDEKARAGCGIYKGKKAPVGGLSLVSKELDPTSAKIGLQRQGEQKVRWLAGLESPLGNAIFWSPSGRYVAYFSYDQYAGDGALALILIDSQSGLWKKVDVKTLKHNKRRKMGIRSYYDLKEGCWTAKSDRFFFQLEVDYLGYSGHPGIDINRKAKLGRFFNKRAPIRLGNYSIFLRPRSR